MDWGEATEFVSFGQVGKDEVDDTTDVYILVAPQNIVGNTIMTVRTHTPLLQRTIWITHTPRCTSQCAIRMICSEIAYASDVYWGWISPFPNCLGPKNACG
jgi:hypothetical protein